MTARSKRAVLVSHCILAQGVMAEGLVRDYPAIVRPVIEFCMDHDLNIIQMECPESHCIAGGIRRRPRGKAWYEKHGLRITCRELASRQVAQIGLLMLGGIDVVGIIGVDFSPACAVNFLNKGRSIQRDSGIFIEELRVALAAEKIDLPFIAISPKWKAKMRRDLENLIALADQAELDLPQ